MEHNTCRENLSAYLDDELPREERLSLESHLAVCPVCSRTLAELKQVSVILKKHAMQPAPLSLKDAVFAEKRERPCFSGWLKPVAAFAGVAAVLLVILALPKTGVREQAGPLAGSSDAYKEESARLALTGNTVGKEDGSSTAAGLPAAGAGGGNRRYQAAAASRGALGQAKFSGVLSRAGAAPATVSSLSGGSAAAAFYGGEAVRGKRAAPAAVPDVAADGVRFAAAHWREGSGKPRNGGSVRAYDARSGDLLWEARVYGVDEDPRLEADVQQVHISALALKGEKLEITDERGNRYRLDIRTRKVDALNPPGPAR